MLPPGKNEIARPGGMPIGEQIENNSLQESLQNGLLLKGILAQNLLACKRLS
jgi:hypothetical protein